MLTASCYSALLYQKTYFCWGNRTLSERKETFFEINLVRIDYKGGRCSFWFPLEGYILSSLWITQSIARLHFQVKTKQKEQNVETVCKKVIVNLENIFTNTNYKFNWVWIVYKNQREKNFFFNSCLRHYRLVRVFTSAAGSNFFPEECFVDFTTRLTLSHQLWINILEPHQELTLWISYA